MKHFLLAAYIAISSTAFAQQSIKPAEAAKHVGDSVRVCGTVDANKYLTTGTSHLTLLDMVGLYPNKAFTVVIPPPCEIAWACSPR